MRFIASLVTFVILAIVLFTGDAFALGGQAAPVAIEHSSGLLFWLTVGVLGTALSAYNPTLLDIKNALDPNDRVAPVIEVLHQQSDVLDDVVMIPGNELTGHVAVVRTGIPAPTWRKLYGSVQPSHSTRVKIRDSFGMLENYLVIDKALADLNGNSAAYHASEASAMLEGFRQEICSSLFYANEDTEPEAFTGIAPRFNSLSAANAGNIIDCEGTSNLTSIYLVVWGANTVHGIYPKGHPAGFQMGATKEETLQSSDGYMEAYKTHFKWDMGLTVLDWRYIVRAANIDHTALTKNAASGADIIDVMTQMLEKVESLSMGRPAFYMSRKLRSFLRRQMVNKVASSTLQMGEVSGRKVITFDDVPVRRIDAITNSESRVVA